MPQLPPPAGGPGLLWQVGPRDPGPCEQHPHRPWSPDPQGAAGLDPCPPSLHTIQTVPEEFGQGLASRAVRAPWKSHSLPDLQPGLPSQRDLKLFDMTSARE